MPTIEEFRRSRAQFSYDELSERFKEEGGLPVREADYKSGYLYHFRTKYGASTLIIIEDERGFIYDWGHPCDSVAKTISEAEEALYESYVA